LAYRRRYTVMVKVKERKPQGGTSNLSARSVGADKTGEKSFVQRYRSHTFNLVQPVNETMTDHSPSEKQRTITSTSVWGSNEICSRDFTTTHNESYLDPADIPHKIGDVKTAAETHAEIMKEKQQRAAMKKLVAMTTTVYGTTSQMLREFHKNKKADLSKYEVKEYMKRNNRGGDLTDDDLNVLFEGINPTDRDTVPAIDFLRRAEEMEFDTGPEEQDLLDMRNYLRQQVADKCERTSTLPPWTGTFDTLPNQLTN
jgi:hypothetical protein